MKDFISAALAVLFTLVDSGIDVLVVIVVVYTTGDSFDCSKLLNRVEPITQTRPDQTRGKEEKRKKRKREKEKKRKREKEKKRKREKGKKGKREKGKKGKREKVK